MSEDASILLHDEVFVHESRAREFEAFVGAHRERAVGLAWKLLGGDGSTAEDVAQEAFVRAHRALGRFRGEAKMSTWFHRILVNEVRRQRRWRFVRLRRSAPFDEDIADVHEAPTFDPALRRRVGDALASLSQGLREAFVLVHLEGFPVDEAAAIMGRASGTLKSHLHRARLALRARLRDLDPNQEAAPR